MGDDQVMVIMETMTRAATTTKEEKETMIAMTADQRKKKLTEVAAKFMGFSFWCAGYGILYTVGNIIIFWDVNKVGLIVSVIPPLLVSCLLLLWAHEYGVKLIDSYLINPQSEMRIGIIWNIFLRLACSSLCPLLQLVILGTQNAKRWDDDGNLLPGCVFVLVLILLIVSIAHHKWICFYMNKNLRPFEEIKQQQLQLQPAAEIRSNSSTTKIDKNQTGCMRVPSL